MFQVRFHGRGGQGVVTAAEMLSVAAFHEGKQAQAFPVFGSERMGAPVMSFCRIDNREIRLRDPVYEPDALIVQDPTLLQSPDLFAGLKEDGFVLVNSARDVDDVVPLTIVERLPVGHVLTVQGTELALKHFKRPMPNAAMLGGLVAMTENLKLSSITAAIRHAFSGAIGEANVAAASEAFDIVAAKKLEREIATRKNKEAIAC
ncbi:MAG: 2-oxoacid:acceptor oxidoreductase family protein [Bdellovibrionales bacterium]|jgi:pyruvate ferredoxin oxidoreductase gamma subunit